VAWCMGVEGCKRFWEMVVKVVELEGKLDNPDIPRVGLPLVAVN
jgi:hypothetical protein